MSARRRTGALCLGLGACLGVCLGACHRRSVEEAAPSVSAPATPDRLGVEEHLPEAETAFGLALPAGMRLRRHFNDAAYFSGELGLEQVLDHVRERVRARDVEAIGQGVVFPRAYVVGDTSQRLLRIELTPIPGGTQLHIQDITPPPALTGTNDAEIWRQAGRNPDGTPIDQNSAY
jgi:hypothetical protein